MLSAIFGELCAGVAEQVTATVETFMAPGRGSSVPSRVITRRRSSPSSPEASASSNPTAEQHGPRDRGRAEPVADGVEGGVERRPVGAVEGEFELCEVLRAEVADGDADQCEAAVSIIG